MDLRREERFQCYEENNTSGRGLRWLHNQNNKQLIIINIIELGL